MIADIARRVKKTGRYTETAELMARRLKQQGVSLDKIRAEVMKILRADKDYQAEVAKNTMEHKREVKALIEQMVKDAEEIGEMKERTNNELKNLSQGTGFAVGSGFESINNAYIKEQDKAILKMATGTFSYDQCVNDMVKALAVSGLRSINYESGRSYQLDTAARMNIRTACHQLSAKISMKNCDEMGTDLVEVLKHWGRESSTRHGRERCIQEVERIKNTLILKRVDMKK